MKLLILGATGGTGRQLVQQALEDANTEVTALVRDASKLGSVANHERLSVVVRATPLTRPALSEVVPGQDAVLVALGAGGAKTPHDLIRGTLAVLLSVMRDAGVRRLVVITAAPVPETPKAAFLLHHVVRPMLWRFFGNDYADMQRAEALLSSDAATDVQWTVVRPPYLTDGGVHKPYRVSADKPLFGRVSRADVARFMLEVVKSDAFVGRGVWVAY